MGYGLFPLSQLEIEILYGDVPIKAHLDFTLISTQPQPTVRILEVKSTAKLPATLSESYAMQIGGQTALLKAYWNLPVFNLVQDTGEVLHHRTFLEICNECLGVSLPDASACDIQGWVLCLSMCDAKAFGPFLPENMDFARCLDMASEFWEAMNDLKENRLNLNTIRTAQGLAPLCPSCFWKEDCPRFKGSSHPEWDAALAQLMDLKVQKKSLDEAIGELEVRLKVAYQLSHTVRGEWINTGNHTFRVIPQSGRVTLDRKRLAEELKNLLGEQKAQTLMARCEKQGEPFGLFRRLTSFDLYGFKPYPLRRSYPMTPPLPGRYDSTSVALDRLSEGTKKTLPRYQDGSSIPLGRLAVSKTFQRRHIVSLLVFDARSAMSLRGRSCLFRLKMSRCSSSIPNACFNRS